MHIVIYTIILFHFVKKPMNMLFCQTIPII